MIRPLFCARMDGTNSRQQRKLLPTLMSIVRSQSSSVSSTTEAFGIINPGDVDENIGAAETLECALRHAFHRCFVGDIDFDRRCFRAERLKLVGHRLGFFRLQIGNDDLGAFAPHTRATARPIP